MQMTAKELAALISGRVVGDEEVTLHAPAKIEEATEGHITFLANPKYEEFLYTTKASAVLVSNDFVPKEKLTCTLIHVEDVYKTLALLLAQYGNGMESQAEISELAFISPEAQIGNTTSVGPFSVISSNATIGDSCTIYSQTYIGPDVKIGNNVIIYPGVRIYSGCVIGDHCVIHSNAVIGSDGFGFNKDENGVYQKVPQIGNVVLGNHVDIGANTVVDRATMGSTIISDGAKLDNLIQIAHNVEVGSNTVIAAQTGIAGSTKIGEEAMIGGQVGIVGHIHIADKTMIQAGSGINRSIKETGAKVYGYPALPYTQYLRAYAVFKELPDLRKRLELLEKQLADKEEESK